MNSSIRIAVQRANALQFHADVLALKYAGSFYGADRAAAELLVSAGVLVHPLPEAGESLLLDPRGSLAVESVLFVGVGPLRSFRYAEVREFARSILEILAEKRSDIRTLSMTSHGVNNGLDVIEAFRSLLAGLLDAVNGGRYPPGLESITIVERDHERADTLRKVLQELVPDGIIETRAGLQQAKLSPEARESLRSAGVESESKPSVFVAMPFAKEFNAVYRYGIEKPSHDAGYVCERADLAVFTGDVMQWVKQRIGHADLVIADLTGKNANVYLEVGFAWGCGKPTMLVVSDAKDLGFDVQGQRCLVYDGDITQLEDLVRKELVGLKRV